MGYCEKNYFTVGLCIYILAVKNNDTNLCFDERVIAANKKDSCLNGVAHKTSDVEDCMGIENSFFKERCVQEVESQSMSN